MHAFEGNGLEIRRFKSMIRKMQSKVCVVFERYYCPLCNKRVKKFLPLSNLFLDNLRKYGWKYKFEDSETCNVKNYSCPFCGGSDRDRLYALYIQQYLTRAQLESTIRIIDFAPSHQLSFYIKKLMAKSKQNIVYRTADLYMENVDDKADVTNLRIYEDNCFDFFICSHVLEHVSDDQRALRELYRILKPGGQGILMVPIVSSIDEIDEDPAVTDVAERWRRFGQGDHVRLYSKKGFLRRVGEAGFVIHQLGQDFFGKKVFTKHGITHQSILYVVEKTNCRKNYEWLSSLALCKFVDGVWHPA